MSSDANNPPKLPLVPTFRRSLSLFLLCFVGLVGCTSTTPYRSLYRETCNFLANGEVDPASKCDVRAAREKMPGYDLAYLEFSDQGWFHHRDSLNGAIELLEKEPERNLNIVVFVHGWKHNAHFNDDDVKHFRTSVLPAFSPKSSNYRTVGIYVGWRGSAYDLPDVIQHASFYDRKSVADHVSRGSVRELFSNLRVIRNSQRIERGKRQVKLTIVGHSFGALIVYNSLSDSILRSIVEANLARDSDTVPLVADLVVLLNPAFEATRFESLFQAAQHGASRVLKNQHFNNTQRPRLVTISSETDIATKVFFPLGRTLNSLFEHEGWTDQDPDPDGPIGSRLEKIANTHTIGHMERYLTHAIDAIPAGAQLQSERAPTRTNLPFQCKPIANSQVENPNRFPLWTMRASASAIDGHHDIYRENLWKFLAHLSLDDKGPTEELCR
jgi:hypothetical protein